MLADIALLGTIQRLPRPTRAEVVREATALYKGDLRFDRQVANQHLDMMLKTGLVTALGATYYLTPQGERYLKQALDSARAVLQAVG